MIRLARYSMSAAVFLFLAVGTWWMFLSHGARNAWAEMIDQVTQIRSATCTLRRRHSGNRTVYLEGSRIRVEEPDSFGVIDFAEGRHLRARESTKTATICPINDCRGTSLVLESNPLIDLIRMKNTFDAMIIAKGLQTGPVPQQEMFTGFLLVIHHLVCFRSMLY